MTPSGQVLVVENSEPCLRIVSIVLQRAGYAVAAARSASEAMALLREQIPDVLVCNLLLGPMGNGFEVIAAVRSTGARVFCIAVTASIDPEMEERSRLSGFDAFLRKPFNPFKLAALLPQAPSGGTAARNGSTTRFTGSSSPSSIRS